MRDAHPNAVLRLGPAAALKAEAVVRDEIAPLLRAGRGREALCLVRSDVKRRRLRAAAVAACGGAAFDLPFYTLEGFVEARRRAAAGGRDGRRLASAIERRVLLEGLLPAGTWPGTVERLGRLFQELGLAEILEPKGFALSRPDGAPWADAFRRYVEALEERDLVDPERALAAVAAAEGRAGAGAPLALLVIDGFYQVPPLVRRLFRALARRAARAVILLDDEGPGEGAEAFEGAARFYRSLGVREEPAPAPAAPAPPVRLLRADTRAAEVEAIARAIRETAARDPDLGADLSRAAVVFPEIGAYAPIVREVFPRAGIPFRLLHGEPLAASAPARALVELALAVESGFERAQVARALLSRSAGFRGRGGRALDYGRLDRIAREAEIAGPIGRAGWRSRLEAHRSELCRALRSGEARAQAKARRDLDALDDGRPVLEEAFDALAALEGEAPASEHRRRLVALAERFEVRARAVATDGDEADAARGAAALAALGEALADVARGLGPDDVPLARFMTALRAALAGATYLAESPEAPGRALVLGRLDIRGLRFDHVFLGGLSAQAFPGARPADPFLTEDERRAFGLATARERLAEMRYLFAGALGAGARSLTLSYALDGAPDDAAAQSPFLVDLARRTPGGLVPEIAPPEGPRTSAAPDALARACAVQRARTEAPAAAGPGPFEGLLSGAALARLRSDLFPEGRPGRLSPSALERYVACPFRAFGERHLGLAPLPEVEDEVTGRDAGAAIHRILRRFYEGFERGAGAGWLATASGRMLAIAREELALEREDAFWRAKSRVLCAGLEPAVADPAPARIGPLRAFLEREAKPDGRVPVALEAEVALSVAGVEVRGVVDRIDAGPSDYYVYDYKTGRRPPEPRDLAEGWLFQVPVYIAAAQARAPGRRPGGGAYLPIVEGRAGERIARLEDGAALARVPEAIQAAIAGMAAGRFHPGDASAERKGCRVCDIRRTCRVDEGRLRAFAAAGAPLVRPLPLLPPAPAEEGDRV